jgi:hypothetical protein
MVISDFVWVTGSNVLEELVSSRRRDVQGEGRPNLDDYNVNLHQVQAASNVAGEHCVSKLVDEWCNLDYRFFV